MCLSTVSTRVPECFPCAKCPSLLRVPKCLSACERLSYQKSLKSRDSRFCCKGGGICGNNTQSLLFKMFIFVLTPFDTWGYYHFKSNLSHGVTYRETRNVVIKSSKHGKMTFPFEFIFVLIRCLWKEGWNFPPVETCHINLWVRNRNNPYNICTRCGSKQ